MTKRKDFSRTKKQSLLPPDPDGRNDKRALWAGIAVVAFQQATGTDDEDALSDLLADLMHWADREHYFFDAALLRGRAHYEAEACEDDVAPSLLKALEMVARDYAYLLEEKMTPQDAQRIHAAIAQAKGRAA
jgi:hypothetical protein